MKHYTTVAEVLDDLDPTRKQQVEMLREMALNAKPGITEGIKWNSPSYIYEGEHRITFNFYKEGSVRLVLHCGAKLKENKQSPHLLRDDKGLVEWSSNIRGIMNFDTIEEIEDKKTAIKAVLNDWLELEL